MLDVFRAGWTPARWGVIRDARRRQRRRQRRVQAMIAAAGVAAAVGWQIIGRVQSGPATGSSLTVGAVQRVPVDGTPLDTTTMRGDLWVLTCARFGEQGATCRAGYLVKIRAASGRVLKRTSVAHPTELAAGDGAIWITHSLTDKVTRVNPRTGQTTATIELRLPHPITTTGWRRFVPSGITVDTGRVTVSSAIGFLAEINPRTARVTRIVPTGSEATSATTANGVTWFAYELYGIGKLTPNGTRATHRRIWWRGQPLDIEPVARGAGLIWALGTESSLTNPSTEVEVVTTIDPRTGRIVHQWPVGSPRLLLGDKTATYNNPSSAMLVTKSATYVKGSSARVLLRLTPPGRIQRLLVPKTASLVAATPHAVWATTGRGQLLRISLRQR